MGTPIITARERWRRYTHKLRVILGYTKHSKMHLAAHLAPPLCRLSFASLPCAHLPPYASHLPSRPLNPSDAPVWETLCLQGWPSIQPELVRIFNFFSFLSALTWLMDIRVLVSLKTKSPSSATVRGCPTASPPCVRSSWLPIPTVRHFFVPSAAL